MQLLKFAPLRSFDLQLENSHFPCNGLAFAEGDERMWKSQFSLFLWNFNYAYRCYKTGVSRVKLMMCLCVCGGQINFGWEEFYRLSSQPKRKRELAASNFGEWARKGGGKGRGEKRENGEKEKFPSFRSGWQQCIVKSGPHFPALYVLVLIFEFNLVDFGAFVFFTFEIRKNCSFLCISGILLRRLFHEFHFPLRFSRWHRL